MIRLGLRLTLGGGREALVRLAVTLAAVGLGVGLLLFALSGMNAINAQNARTAWLNTGEFHGAGLQSGLPSAPGDRRAASPLWWLASSDHLAKQTIDRVDVAATGADAPVPPGMSGLPGPGQFYASPALAKLLRTTPASELSERFPGRQVGTIGRSALPAPDSLIIVIGHTPAQMSAIPGSAEVTLINTTTGHSSGANGWDSNKLQIILAIGALALLFPILVFIGTATRISAARREQRFAAMRLIGATPRQVSVLCAVESTVAALGGVLVGFGVFVVVRPVVTNMAFTGQRFAPGDMSLRPADIVLIVLGVPIAAAVAGRLAMRRVHISPLGVTRRVTPPAPRMYRLLPLAAGIAELGYYVAAGSPKGTGAQIAAYFAGCLLIMAGLVIAGPWLTLIGSRLLVRRARHVSALIAARRLSDNPKAAFRAVAGLSIAIFVTSVSVGVITTILNDHSATTGTAASDTLVDQFVPPPPADHPASTPTVPDRLLYQLRVTSGVKGVAVIYREATGGHEAPERAGSSFNQLALCDQIATTPAIGRCPPGAQVITITANIGDNTATGKSALAHTVWPAAAITPTQLRSFPIRGLVVQTGRSGATVEHARTLLEVALPGQGLPTTLGEINAASTRTITELQQLTNVVIILSLIVAGCSLAVSVIAGITDRKRPFSLLRLTGVPIKTLRRVVAIEAAVPLAVVAFLAAALGFLAAALLLKSQLGETLQPPRLDYYLLLSAGLVTSLAIIASTMPLIERITGPEVVRNE